MPGEGDAEYTATDPFFLHQLILCAPSEPRSPSTGFDSAFVGRYYCLLFLSAGSPSLRLFPSSNAVLLECSPLRRRNHL
jgi:hypothetical protein